ncbi:hypothetical protein [Streptomyces sp. NPDC056600]|uniref:hypothetical protein n=1 Tax=Streptomyces sp. NPDC056600 TaxID=3345874 RepID=UPI0036B62882
MPAEDPSPSPFPDSTLQRPDPRSARLRAQRPVTRAAVAEGGPTRPVTRYEDIRSMAADHRFNRAAAHPPRSPQLGGQPQAPPTTIVSLNPPDHTRPRRPAQQTFDAARERSIEPHTTEPADGLLDEPVAKKAPDETPADLLNGSATPLAPTVIRELPGVPQADHDRSHSRVRQLATVRGPEEEATATRDQLGGYLAGLAAEKRQHPTADDLSALIADHPDTRRAPGEDPPLLPAAVKELLRGVNLFATNPPRACPHHHPGRHPGAGSPSPPGTRCPRPSPPPTTTPRPSPPPTSWTPPAPTPPSGLRREPAFGASRPARPARRLVNRPRQPRSHP